MFRGLYTAASGMRAELEKLEVRAHNLANLSTDGFRGQRIAQRSFLQELAAAQHSRETLRGGSLVAATELDLRPGPVRQTGNPLDLALEGPGFFVIQTPAGERLTRAGNFRLDEQGRLVNAAGHPVLGDTGPLVLTGGEVRITEQGQVTVAGALAGQLRLVEPVPGAELRAEGGALLATAATTPSGATRVRAGHLESANVQGVLELTAMMRGLRLYEANAEALRAQDRGLEEFIRGAAGE